MQLLNRVACALKLMPGTPQEFGKAEVMAALRISSLFLK